jgi:hypothetical protein
MNDFFHRVDPQDAADIERLSRLIYELRENRHAVLRRHGVADEAALLQRLRDGDVPEHPGYDDYLAACTLGSARDAASAELKALLKHLGG